MSDSSRSGAPIRDDERPKERTLALALMTIGYRGMVVQTGDTFSVNDENRDLLEFYANSIEHLNADRATKPRVERESARAKTPKRARSADINIQPA